MDVCGLSPFLLSHIFIRFIVCTTQPRPVYLSFASPQTSSLCLSVVSLQVMLALGDYMNVQCHCCIGGLSIGEDIRKLDYGQVRNNGVRVFCVPVPALVATILTSLLFSSC